MVNMSDDPFQDFYAADAECMKAIALNDMEAYHAASIKLDAALSRIKPPQVPDSWDEQP